VALRSKKNIYYINPEWIVRPAGGRKDWKWYAEYHLHKHIYWPFQSLGGNWDQISTVKELFREDEMNELFVKKLPIQETTTYKELFAELKKNGFTRFPRTHSLEEINAYFERVQKVYESMKSEGYKTSDELGLPRMNEIHVRITRKGEFVKAGEGTHRLAMAKLLGIKEIPVVVDLVHSSLMKRWKKACKNTRCDPVAYGIECLKEHIINT